MGSYPAPSNIPQFGTLQNWQANTYYAIGQRAANSGNVYQVTAAGTSAGAGGPTGSGGAIVDNTVTWAYQWAIAPAWVASTAYAVGAVVTNGGGIYECITAGTSAGSGGPTGTGNVIPDNTVTWTYTASGIAQQTAPTDRAQDLGAVPNAPFFAQYFNWWAALVTGWILYLRDLGITVANLFSTAHTWTALQAFNGTGGDGEAARAISTVATPSGAGAWAAIWSFGVASHFVRIMIDGAGSSGIFVDCNWDTGSSTFKYDPVKTAAWAMFFPVTGAGSWGFFRHIGANGWAIGDWVDDVVITPGIATAFSGGVEIKSGDVTVDTGSIAVTVGDLTLANGNVHVTAGDILAPAGSLNVGGYVTTQRIVGQTGTAPTAAINGGTGAGGGAGAPTVTAGSVDLCGQVSIHAGTAPSVIDKWYTVTLHGSYSTAPRFVSLYPANNIGGVSVTFYATNIAAAIGVCTFDVWCNGNSTALDSLTIKINYHVVA